MFFIFNSMYFLHLSKVKINQECRMLFSESGVLVGNKPMRNNPLFLIGEPWMGGSESREAGPALQD